MSQHRAMASIINREQAISSCSLLIRCVVEVWRLGVVLECLLRCPVCGGC